MSGPYRTGDDKRGIRCPHCDKKVAEHLDGRMTFLCPRCKAVVLVTHDTQTNQLFYPGTYPK